MMGTITPSNESFHKFSSTALVTSAMLDLFIWNQNVIPTSMLCDSFMGESALETTKNESSEILASPINESHSIDYHRSVDKWLSNQWSQLEFFPFNTKVQQFVLIANCSSEICSKVSRYYVQSGLTKLIFIFLSVALLACSFFLFFVFNREHSTL